MPGNQRQTLQAAGQRPRRRTQRAAGTGSRRWMASIASIGSSFQQVVNCPRCQSQIARECVATKSGPAAGVKTIAGYCEFCHLLALARYRQESGVWLIDGACEVLSDPTDPRFKSALARLATLRGDRLCEKPQP